ncbi:MAG: nucleoside-triphosphatase [Velocimicrobium sp.]
MHIFLTGEIQIGKTTIIKKTLFLLSKKEGGFCTYFGLDREMPNRWLYMNDASLPNIYQKDHAVACFHAGYAPLTLIDQFDVFGAELIRKAKDKADIIIMDECGSLEEEAFCFQEEVLNALDGDIPVFGVIKLSSTGWTEKIRSHPKVKLFFVTKENRDALPEKIAREFSV